MCNGETLPDRLRVMPLQDWKAENKLLPKSNRGKSLHDALAFYQQNKIRLAEEGKMKCVHCQGEMRKGTTPFHVDRKGCHVLLDNVPAWVCQQCGEAYFEENEVDAIQDLINSVEQKADALVATG